ncbi:hypothetical protein ACWDRB_47265 [Nonomuraea sp. NPDC003707]
MDLDYVFTAIHIVTRLRLRNADPVPNPEGRMFYPDTIEVNWVWQPRLDGWGWTHADVTGPYDDEHLRAIPFNEPFAAQQGAYLPRDLEPLVEVTRPAWTPPAECSECGTPMNVAQQRNHQSGEVVLLCQDCHHEAVSGT